MDRCLVTIDVCIRHMFVFMSVVMTVWGLWECLLCSGHCESGFLSFRVCLCKGCDVVCSVVLWRVEL